jgi:hypothetical protein
MSLITNSLALLIVGISISIILILYLAVTRLEGIAMRISRRIPKEVFLRSNTNATSTDNWNVLFEKNCSNCVYKLDRFYYWKENICNKCSRSSKQQFVLNVQANKDYWKKRRFYGNP